MKVIYKYIFQELLTPFAFGVAAFVGIFVGTDLLFDLTQYFTEYGIGVLTLVQLFFLNLPSIIVLSFPMATLLATIIGYSRLSGDSEITALRAGGISIYKLVLPALIIGLFMSVFTIGINEFIVPEANYLANKIVWEFQHNQEFPRTQSNLFLRPMDSSSNRPDYILYANKYNGDSGEMTDLVIQDFEQGSPSAVIEAERGKWSQEDWFLYNGIVYNIKQGERMPVMRFEEYRAEQINYTPTQISRMDKDIDDMSMRELKRHIQLLTEQGEEPVEEWVEWHQRLSIPFANFIFVLLAAPLGIKPRRSSGSATGMGLSIIVIFIYYIIMMLGSALGGAGTIPPWLGAWLQNIIFLVIGTGLLFKVAR